VPAEIAVYEEASDMGPSVATLSLSTPALDFDELVERYGGEIYRFSLRLARDRSDADDLYQESLLKAYRAFDRLARDANQRAWLYRIVTNTFLSGKRKLGRIDPLDGEAESQIPAASVDLEAKLDARDLLLEVERSVATLPDKQRVALILRKYHEMDYAEIAMNLKCSEAAARANVHEALRKLRASFGDRL
jgi:RNA polymerase sigma-70 factor, ECF subfamily